MTLKLPAPAKLNLMLHVTGRRSDGYHQLQTLFQFLDFSDEISLETRDNGAIELETDKIFDVDAQQNLIMRAAKQLQQASSTQLGAQIKLTKRIPMGGGLGGGSSDAATTLVGLNQLWRTGFSLDQLAELGLTLGADVPVFVHGCAAWAEGVGEQLVAVTLDEPVFVVITPSCTVSTGEIFSHKELTRNTSPITIAAALSYGGQNDCEKLVKQLYPKVKRALDWLGQFADARMTGTGAGIFAAFKSDADANKVLQQIPGDLTGFVARGLNRSPLHQAANVKTTLDIDIGV